MLGKNDTSTCSVRLVTPFREALELNAAQVCYLSELHADQRVPHRVIVSVLRHAVLVSREPALGLRAAARATDATFDLLEYLVKSAPNLLAGAQVAKEHLALLHDGAVLRVQVSRREVVVCFSLEPGLSVTRELSEFMMAGLLGCFQRVCGYAITPVRATFRHDPPRQLSPHRDTFGCPLDFGADADALHFCTEEMQLPIETADPVLHALLLCLARDRIEAHARRSTFALRVEELVASQLWQGDPSISTISKLLGMSERSLSRRLSEERTTYRLLVDGLRRQLAIQHLEDSDHSLEEIAFLLGFSRAAAFYRAFRRWIPGETPSSYRRRMTAGGPRA